MEQKKEEKKAEEHEKSDEFKKIKGEIIEFLVKKYQSKYGRTLRELLIRGKFLDKELEEEYYRLFDEKSKKNEEISNLKKQIDELTDTLKRLQAEFENYKKWNAKEKTEFVKYAHADVIAEMLPVLDSFEIALKSLKINDFQDAKNPKDFSANTTDKDKFIEGMKIIYAQFHSILEAEGLKPIKSVGEKFDPYRHEVLMKEESDKPEETVLEEFQKGYMLNDKVLRHSKVKISGK